MMAKHTIPPDARAESSFSIATALATLVALFLFAGIVMFIYRSANPLAEPKRELARDPIERLDDVRSRNKAVLDGSDPTVKMSIEQSMAAIMDGAARSKDEHSPHGRLPFPVEPSKP